MKSVSASFKATERLPSREVTDRAFLYIEYPFKITAHSPLLTLDGNATTHISVGDTIVLSKRGFTNEYVVAGVSYSSIDKETSITVTGQSWHTDDIGGYVRKKLAVIDNIIGGIGPIRRKLEGMSLNTFSSGSLSLNFSNIDRSFYNAINETGIFFYPSYRRAITAVGSDTLDITPGDLVADTLIGMELTVVTGDAMGRSYAIVDNTTSQVTLATGGVDLSTIITTDDTVIANKKNRIYLRVTCGYRELSETVAVFAGKADIEEIEVDARGDKVSVSFNGLLSELREKPAFNAVEANAKLARIPAITILDYTEATRQPIYGPKNLSYSIEGSHLTGIEVYAVSGGVWPGVYSLRFRSPNWFSFAYGAWKQVSVGNLSDGKLRLIAADGTEWLELAFDAVDIVDVSALFPGVVSHEEFVWIEGPEYGLKSTLTTIVESKRHMWSRSARSPRQVFHESRVAPAGAREVAQMGVPAIAFDNGEPTPVSMLIEEVQRYNTTAKTWTDLSGGAIDDSSAIVLMTATDDYVYFCCTDKFWGLDFLFKVLWIGAPVIEVAYSRTESIYIDLTAGDNGFADGTAGFTQNGAITWDTIDDWGIGALRISATEVATGYIIRIKASTLGTGTLTLTQVTKRQRAQGQYGDLVDFEVDMDKLPGEDMSDTIVVFDDNGTSKAGAWKTSAPVGRLCNEVIEAGGFTDSPVSLHDDIISVGLLELESAMSVVCGDAPRPLYYKRPSALCADPNTGTLYIGVEDELWTFSEANGYEYMGRIVLGELENYPASKMKIRKLAVTGTGGSTTVNGLAHQGVFRRGASLGSADVLGGTFTALATARGTTLPVIDTDIFPGTYSMRFGAFTPRNIGGVDLPWRRYIGIAPPQPSPYYSGGESIVLPFQQVFGCRYSNVDEAEAHIDASEGLLGDGIDIGGAWGFPLVAILKPGNESVFGSQYPAGPYCTGWPGSFYVWGGAASSGVASIQIRFTFGQDGFIGVLPALNGSSLAFMHFGYFGETMGNAWNSLAVEPPGYLWHSYVEGRIRLPYKHHTGDQYQRVMFPTPLEQPLCGCVDSSDRIFLGHIAWVEEYEAIAGTFVSIVSENDDLKPFEKIIQYDSSGGVYLDRTSALNAGATPAIQFDTNDYIYIGSDKPFLAVHFECTDGTNAIASVEQCCKNDAVLGWHVVPNTTNGWPGVKDYTFGFSINGTISWRCVKGNVDHASYWNNHWTLRTIYMTGIGSNKLYWTRIKLASSAKISRITNHWRVIWHSFDYDDEGGTSYADSDTFVPLSLAYNENEDAVHCCFWNRDTGEATKYGWAGVDTRPRWYVYGVVSSATSHVKDAVTFTQTTSPSGTLDYNIARPIQKLKYNSLDNKVYGVLVDAFYGKFDAKLVRCSFSAPTITIDDLGVVAEGEKGITGDLAFTTGAVWGLGLTRPVLWKYSTSVTPYVFLADFSDADCLSVLASLFQMFNGVLYVTEDGYFRGKSRDGTLGTIDITQMLKSCTPGEVYEHNYDTVEVDWSDTYDRSGMKPTGTSGWGRDALGVSNAFIQDPSVAYVVSRNLAKYFLVRRQRNVLKTTSVLETEVLDKIWYVVDSSVMNVKSSKEWKVLDIELNPSRQEMTFRAITEVD